MNHEIRKMEDTETYKCYMVVNGDRIICLEWYDTNFKATNPIDRAMEGYGNDHVVIHTYGVPETNKEFVYCHIINHIDEDAFYQLIKTYEYIIGAQPVKVCLCRGTGWLTLSTPCSCNPEGKE